MLNMTETEVDTVLADVRNRGWDNLDREDVICAAQYVEDPRDLIALLGEWHRDYEREAEAESRAAAWFEDASYGSPD